MTHPKLTPGQAAREKAREGNADREYYGDDYNWDAIAAAAIEASRESEPESGELVSELVREATAAALDSANMATPPAPDATEREHAERVAASFDTDKYATRDDRTEVLLSERAAAFEAGDKAGYSRGLADGRELPRSVDRTERDALEAKLKDLIEAASAVSELATKSPLVGDYPVGSWLWCIQQLRTALRRSREGK